ncbi:unnamed protein product [Phytophthora fragariaefolia]|uniref:Unnamed protein product n=1 Tax=Phytophthora fragariaefolia TaxID=1490495 RepID=A0A9W6YKW2_9STRA|nr:unnamed protein product [Phytophthora fragariaefolia]
MGPDLSRLVSTLIGNFVSGVKFPGVGGTGKMVQVAIWEVPGRWYKWRSGRYQRSGTSVDQIDTGTWPSDRHDYIQVQGWYQENGTSTDQIDTGTGRSDRTAIQIQIDMVQSFRQP